MPGLLNREPFKKITQRPKIPTRATSALLSTYIIRSRGLFSWYPQDTLKINWTLEHKKKIINCEFLMIGVTYIIFESPTFIAMSRNE